MNMVSVIGFGVAIAGGLGVVAALLYATARLSVEYGCHAWESLSRIYQVEVMRYWLKRMDAEGTHIMRMEYENGRAKENA